MHWAPPSEALETAQTICNEFVHMQCNLKFRVIWKALLGPKIWIWESSAFCCSHTGQFAVMMSGKIGIFILNSVLPNNSICKAQNIWNELCQHLHQRFTRIMKLRGLLFKSMFSSITIMQEGLDQFGKFSLVSEIGLKIASKWPRRPGS